MRWLLRIITSLLLLALIGMGHQIVGKVQDRRHYPPPGRLIDVGGHTLHLYCTGEGSPTVILEAAGPGWSVYWSKVQPEISKVTRVCSYDRAGFGWSDSGPLPRSGQQMAKELHQLLTRAGISGPYVLVGHSLGGFIVRLYRQAHPDDVVGMVLVDAGHERQFEQEEFRKFVAPGKILFPIIRAVTALGLTRLLITLDLSPSFFSEQEKNVAAEVRPLLRTGWMQTRYFKTMADEGGGAGRDRCANRTNWLVGRSAVDRCHRHRADLVARNAPDHRPRRVPHDVARPPSRSHETLGQQPPGLRRPQQPLHELRPTRADRQGDPADDRREYYRITVALPIRIQPETGRTEGAFI